MLKIVATRATRMPVSPAAWSSSSRTRVVFVVFQHVAAVRVPGVHELVPDTTYPESHVGWHVDPLARELVQSPTPPLVGAVDASQGSAEHVAAVRVPRLHDDVPDTVYPELHVG